MAKAITKVAGEIEGIISFQVRRAAAALDRAAQGVAPVGAEAS